MSGATVDVPRELRLFNHDEAAEVLERLTITAADADRRREQAERELATARKELRGLYVELALATRASN